MQHAQTDGFGKDLGVELQFAKALWLSRHACPCPEKCTMTGAPAEESLCCVQVSDANWWDMDAAAMDARAAAVSKETRDWNA